MFGLRTQKPIGSEAGSIAQMVGVSFTCEPANSAQHAEILLRDRAGLDQFWLYFMHDSAGFALVEELIGLGDESVGVLADHVEGELQEAGEGFVVEAADGGAGKG